MVYKALNKITLFASNYFARLFHRFDFDSLGLIHLHMTWIVTWFKYLMTWLETLDRMTGGSSMIPSSKQSQIWAEWMHPDLTGRFEEQVVTKHED